ncbi:hypothetical protein [Amycolatopsis jiangsuensis]|uniref:Uncharacterized protein n=1 Tax=Amycolatopsis jiangsuensis TaxID=1181879 RepID=A0A840IP45_9PSEU|nr:hypothetical protein [Amycolatopsis jiangsuensis]MBB4683720.1 hypothetical protein [Amycolatopsis jiangsuensis]
MTVFIARPLPGMVGESRRVVHVFPLPAEGLAPERLTAYCGAMFGRSELELLERPVGMPCVTCLRLAPTPGDADRPAIDR